MWSRFDSLLAGYSLLAVRYSLLGKTRGKPEAEQPAARSEKRPDMLK
jgi:hypothetical protein